MTNTQTELPSTTSTELIVSEERRGYNVYTNEDRRSAAVAFVLYGNVQKVAEITGFPDKTIYGWLKSDWWPRFLDEAKREHQELIESRLSDIVEKATWQLIDRIENGDSILNKRGHVVRVPVKAKDLDIIIRDSIDKIRLLRNQPSKVTAEVKFDADKIAKNFAEIAEKYHDKIVSEQ